MKNKTIIRLMALLLCLSLMAAGLSACGAGTVPSGSGSDAAPSGPAEGSGTVPEAPPQTQGGESQGGSTPPEQPVTPPEPEGPNDKEVYELFLDDAYGVSVSETMYGLEPGRTYSLYEFAQTAEASMKDEYMPDKLVELKWSLIDCGADGVPELALMLTFGKEHEGYFDTSTEYFILKNYEDGLKVVENDSTYYRYESTINRYGYITYGGSDGAASYGYSNRFVNADGESIFLYSGYYTLAHADAVIPYYYLPQEKLPEDYPTDYSFEDEGIEIDIYNFDPYESYDEDTAEEHASYNMFVFLDSDGKDVPPDERYAALYEELGVVTVTDGEMQELIRKHEEELGVTDQIRDGEGIEWTLYEADWLPKG